MRHTDYTSCPCGCKGGELRGTCWYHPVTVRGMTARGWPTSTVVMCPVGPQVGDRGPNPNADGRARLAARGIMVDADGNL